MKCYGAGGDGKSCSTQGFLQGQICSIRATMLPAHLPPVGYAPRASFGQYWLHLPSPGINSKKRGWSWGLLYHPAHTVCTLAVPVETFAMTSSPLPSLVSGRFWCAVTSSSCCRDVAVSQMCTWTQLSQPVSLIRLLIACSALASTNPTQTMGLSVFTQAKYPKEVWAGLLVVQGSSP